MPESFTKKNKINCGAWEVRSRKVQFLFLFLQQITISEEGSGILVYFQGRYSDLANAYSDHTIYYPNRDISENKRKKERQ